MLMSFFHLSMQAMMAAMQAPGLAHANPEEAVKPSIAALLAAGVDKQVDVGQSRALPDFEKFWSSSLGRVQLLKHTKKLWLGNRCHAGMCVSTLPPL